MAVQIEEGLKLDFKDVLIKPKRSTFTSRSEVDLNRTFRFLHSGQEWTGVPIIASNMDGVGTFKMAEAIGGENGMLTCLAKHTDKTELNNNFWGDFYCDYCIYSMGITDIDMLKFSEIYNFVDKGIRFLCIDVANGYSESFIDFVKKMRDNYPDITIIAGNVVTPEITEQLILSGADVVKVGIGPGSVCTTRVKTGIGYPQLSATMECSDAAHGIGGYIVTDGGCTVPGDIMKAFGGGADFVMLGGMLAGHYEGGGKIIEREIYTNEVSIHTPNRVTNKEKLVQFYGMSSQEAQENHGSSLKDYRASEGKAVEVPYKGMVKDTIQDILGGIRSGMTYIGAKRLKDIDRCATFVRVTQQENRIFSNV